MLSQGIIEKLAIVFSTIQEAYSKVGTLIESAELRNAIQEIQQSVEILSNNSNPFILFFNFSLKASENP